MLARILFIVVFFVGTAWAQSSLDNYKITPIRDPQIPILRELKVKMKRTLDLKDTTNWKPTDCDYWDTTYYRHGKYETKALFIGFDPMEVEDYYNIHNCYNDPGPKSGYPADHVFTHEDSVYAQEEALKPKPMWPSPSDSIKSTYDVYGNLLSREVISYSGSSKPKAEYYYFENNHQCAGHSIYNVFGLKDSTHLFFNAMGKLVKYLKVTQQSVHEGGVTRMNLHFIWDTSVVRFVYDSADTFLDIYHEANRPKIIVDSNGKKTRVITKVVYRESETFDALHRRTGFIAYKENGTADTAQRWAYSGDENVYTVTATAPWIKKPTPVTDSSIYDTNHRKIGILRIGNQDGETMRELSINGITVSRIAYSNEWKKMKRKYDLQSDADGNILRKEDWYQGNYGYPISSVLEYKYNDKKLLTDAYFVHDEGKQRDARNKKRHLQYLYTYQK